MRLTITVTRRKIILGYSLVVSVVHPSGYVMTTLVLWMAGLGLLIGAIAKSEGQVISSSLSCLLILYPPVGHLHFDCN